MAINRHRYSPEQGSEYGGVPGLIQPTPHDPQESPREMLWMIYKTKPEAGYVDGTNPIDDQEIPQTEGL